MTSYDIYFTLRGSQHKALVQDYGTFKLITLEHGELSVDYGYRIELTDKMTTARSGKDARDLERAIRDQLK